MVAERHSTRAAQPEKSNGEVLTCQAQAPLNLAEEELQLAVGKVKTILTWRGKVEAAVWDIHVMKYSQPDQLS